MKNEQIDRGIDIVADEEFKTVVTVRMLINVLEAMKEPRVTVCCNVMGDPADKCHLCKEHVDRCKCDECKRFVFCNDTHVQSKSKKPIKKKYAFDPINGEIVLLNDDKVIREVYENWKDCNIEIEEAPSGDGYVTIELAFFEDMWKAIKQYCEDK